MGKAQRIARILPHPGGQFPTPARRRRRRADAVLALAMCAALAQVGGGCARQSHTFAALDDAPETHSTQRHATIIRKPDGPPAISTGRVDEKGNPIAISCAVCHATKPANGAARLGTGLELFHQGLAGAHGNLACQACHNPADGYATLRLADGTSLPYSEVMSLCAQCHGPQYRDYQHGAHGGMVGFWDLTKGGRVRNNCIDCHHPHAPRYPTVAPAPGPKDRFQTGGRHE